MCSLSYSKQNSSLDSVNMSAHYNGSLSIIHDGLDSIKMGLETIETYIQSALYLYHDKKYILQGKEHLSKGFRKTKASLLQGYCKMKQGVDTISKKLIFQNAGLTVIALYILVKFKQHTTLPHETSCAPKISRTY